MRLNRTSIAVIAVLLASSIAALAANTTFFTSLGDQVFPFKAPTASAPGTIDNMTIGATTPRNVNALAIVANTIAGVVTNTSATPITQGAPFAATVSATLTAANLQTGIITVTQGGGANSAQQLPLATAMDTAFPVSVAGSAFDFTVINLGAASETDSITTNTGWTLVGTMTQAVGASARFRARKTGTGAWTLYRLT